MDDPSESSDRARAAPQSGTDSARAAPQSGRDKAQRALAPGTKVEVRRRFDNRWARGFEVAAADGDGYLVRRLSDSTVLPVPFAREDLRRERQGTWWF